MPYRVQSKRPAQQSQFQVTHATALLPMMTGTSSGRLPPQNLTGLAQPFPTPSDWRQRAGSGLTPGPSALHSRMYLDQDSPRIY